MKKTIEKINKQHAVLVQAIQTIDDEFYTRRMSPEMQALRDALDKILNHSDKLHEESNMELEIYQVKKRHEIKKD